jgi:phosphorylcholine metabolism protein LicD
MIINEKSKNSLEFLKLITSELDKNNIPHWIDCGTLLGAYRESDFIEHDDDIDISVNIDHLNIVTNIVANADFSGLIADVNKVAASLSKLQAQIIQQFKP